MQLCNGVLCGLVAVTPGCGVIDPWAGILVAVLAAAVYLGIDTMMLRAQLDDVVGAVPMHLGCGVLGTLWVGLFAREHFVNDFYPDNPAGVYRWPCCGPPAVHDNPPVPPQNMSFFAEQRRSLYVVTLAAGRLSVYVWCSGMRQGPMRVDLTSATSAAAAVVLCCWRCSCVQTYYTYSHSSVGRLFRR